MNPEKRAVPRRKVNKRTFRKKPSGKDVARGFWTSFKILFKTVFMLIIVVGCIAGGLLMGVVAGCIITTEPLTEEQLDITLTQEQRDQVEQLLRQANELGLDQEDILNGAQKLYEQYGSALMESADAAIRENIVEPVKDAVVEETKNTFRDFFRDMGNTVRDFVMSLIG